MDHSLSRIIIISKVVELIANELKITLSDARDLFYSSKVISILEDEESGLYGESPYKTFELFMNEYKNKKK